MRYNVKPPDDDLAHNVKCAPIICVLCVINYACCINIYFLFLTEISVVSIQGFVVVL